MNVEAILIENERRKEATDCDSFAAADTFAAWARENVKIKPKGGGAAVPFTLNRPQRRLVAALEEMRRANLPIRLILLKARQWGGRT